MRKPPGIVATDILLAPGRRRNARRTHIALTHSFSTVRSFDHRGDLQRVPIRGAILGS
ncbi:MAG: hypothetical protein HXY20_14870 [Acidobacteria bacterium]|nr:hypothetical protein [Acidobacteriota bacterium]